MCFVLLVASVLAGAFPSDGSSLRSQHSLDSSLQLRSQHSLDSSLRSKAFGRFLSSKGPPVPPAVEAGRTPHYHPSPSAFASTLRKARAEYHSAPVIKVKRQDAALHFVLLVASVLAGALTCDGSSLQLRSQHSLESSLRSKAFQRALLAKESPTLTGGIGLQSVKRRRSAARRAASGAVCRPGCSPERRVGTRRERAARVRARARRHRRDHAVNVTEFMGAAVRVR